MTSKKMTILRKIHKKLSKTEITNIQIDPNGFCTQKCWFCPVRYEPRLNLEVMSIHWFDYILEQINECIELGHISKTYQLWLSSYNEITADPYLEQRLECLRKHKAKFYLLSNGFNILKHIELLHSYKDVILSYVINLPAGNAIDFKKFTQRSEKDFYSVLNGLTQLYSLDPVYYKKNIAISINGVYDNCRSLKHSLYQLPLGDTDKQVAQLKDCFPFLPRITENRPLCDRAGILKKYNAIDNLINKNLSIPHFCKNGGKNGGRLYEWLHIGCNGPDGAGNLYTCCQDYQETYTYGTLKTTSLAELIHSKERAKAILDSTKKMCLECIYYNQVKEESELKLL